LRELELKEKLAQGDIELTEAKAVQTGVQSSYSAMQAGAQFAQMPMIAPIADEIMKGAGYQLPNPMGDDPNFPTADQTTAMNIKSPYIKGQQVQQNTSPASPPVPQQAGTGRQGIETAMINDNFN